MKNFFSMFWSETPNVWSSKRFISVFIAVAWTVALVAVETVSAVKTGQFLVIPDSIVNIYLLTLAVTFGFQVGGTAVDMLKGKPEADK